MTALLLRDLRRALGGAALPVAFFLLCATLFPFAVGPDPRLLARVGAGLLWAAALLAALLPVERLVAPDLDGGVLDQLAVRGVADEAVTAIRIAAHWLALGPPLMLATLPGAALLALPAATLLRLELGLLIGTPALAALGVAVAAVTASLRGAGALAGLLLLPLAVPVLIFGVGVATGAAGAARLLAAASLVVTAGAPFAAGAALRASRD